MAARPTKQVAVTDAVYNEWLQEVKALKPRKQKHWQDWLRNQRGEKSRVRFNVETPSPLGPPGNTKPGSTQRA